MGAQDEEAVCGPPIALLTGASRGLGAAILAHLQALNYIVVALQRTPIHGHNIRAFAVDLCDSVQLSVCISQLINELPHLDLLVNNAAICPREENTTWGEVIQVNFHAPLQVIEGLFPLLHKSPYFARVINISSGDGELIYFASEPRAILSKLDECGSSGELVSSVQNLCKVVAQAHDDRFVYGAQKAYKLSKAGMNGYTRYAARRYKGVKLLAICPGDVDTDMGDSAAAEEVICADEAVRRMGEVFDVRKEWGNGSGGFWRFGRRIDW